MDDDLHDTPAGKPIPTTTVREALIIAARSEFEEQGYAGARTREIARRAGTSEVMLFRHFKSKANLFKETVFYPFDHYMTQFIEDNFHEDTPRKFSSDHWRKFSSRLFALLNQNNALLTALIVAFNYDKDDISGVHDLTSMELFFKHASLALTRNITAENADRAPNPDITVRLTFALMASVALFQPWLFPESVAPVEVVIEEMKRFNERALGMDDDV